MLMLLLLVACADESSNEPQSGNLHLSSVTRTSSPLTPEENNSIKMYVMTKDGQYTDGSFSYTNGWVNSNVNVGEHAQYYIYGYMPASYSSSISAESSDLNGDYSKGADLTITELPLFPTDDICVIVGVQKVSGSSEVTEATEGNYGYLSGLNSENYVNLLMDHLYSQLILQFNVDATYNALRHIKLKTVTLTSTYGDKVDVTIKHRAGSGLVANTVAYSKNSGATDETSKEVLTESDAKFITTTATDTQYGPFNCAPCTFDAGTNLTLTCTYDVYNTDETDVVRENCTATNKLKVTSVDHGVRKTLTITIVPTYLYTLSDDDLNNPSLEVKID